MHLSSEGSLEFFSFIISRCTAVYVHIGKRTEARWS